MTSLVAMEMNDRDHEDDQLLDADSFDGLALYDKSRSFGGNGGGKYNDEPEFPPYDEWYVSYIQVCSGPKHIYSLIYHVSSWNHPGAGYYSYAHGKSGGSC